MILVAMLLAAAPTTAAQIDCVEQSLTPAAREALSRSAGALDGDGADRDTANDAAADSGLIAAMTSCRTRFGWSEAAAEDAAKVARAAYGMAAAARRARAAAIDPDKVAAGTRAMSADDRHGLVTGQDAGVAAFVAAMTKAGVPLDTDARQLAAGQIAGMTIAADEARARFLTE